MCSTDRFFKMLTSSLLLLLVWIGPLELLGQQSTCITCIESSPEKPMELALAENCEATLVLSDFERANTICTGEKQMTVRNAEDDILGTSTDVLTLKPGQFTGQILELTLESLLDESSCIVYIRFYENEPPGILCENRRIFCGADTSVTELGYPIVTDNCIAAISLTYEDIIIGQGCIGNNSLVISREWRATDNSGNYSTCSQTISVERPDITAVQFPTDQRLSCTQENTSPELTGYPTLFGERIDYGDFCNIVVGYEDDTTSVCGEVGFEILRQWLVIDRCTGLNITHLQSIKVIDNVVPELIVPEEITVATNPGHCFATVELPLPEVYDNCDADVVVTAVASYGQNGFEKHLFVPQGIHRVKYAALDKCGNYIEKSVRLRVVDKETPTSIADEYTSVSIPNGGYSRIAADVFDSGSYDNCADTVYFKVRKQDQGTCEGVNGDDNPFTNAYDEWFDDFVFFCCAEVGTQVKVLMRVYDKYPGNGPVDPAREEPGGDLHGHFTDALINVSVQDNVAPKISKLENVILDCEDDIENLQRFGSPEVEDICGFEVDSTVNYYLDECGTGRIERTWSAIDTYGNASKMTQVIYVINEEPFDESQIIWPQHYKTHRCVSELAPDQLRYPHNRPQLLDESCARIDVAYSDQLYRLSQGNACYKIIRRWTVKDLCTYQPGQADSPGLFEFAQVIEVIDTVAPELVVPRDTIVSIDEACDEAIVNLPAAYIADCSSNTNISSDSKFAYRTNANASGIYPRGKSTVTFTATDQCGNTVQKSMTITVKDETAPAVSCRIGFAVTLATLEDRTEAVLTATDINLGSTDNCDSEALDFTIQKTPIATNSVATTDELYFSCSELGRQPVELWATDQSGNAGSCLTYVEVIDPDGECPDNIDGGNNSEIQTAIISGNIRTEAGFWVENVNVHLGGGQEALTLTNMDGAYAFQNLATRETYSITPKKNQDAMNGVSTLDLVFIAKHISGVRRLDSPYKIIAADIDGNGNVSTLDLINLRKLLLNLEDNLPNNQAAWRFVDAQQQFNDPSNPLEEGMNNQYTIGALEKDTLADFIGIKVGDVNTSVQANSMMQLEHRSDQRIMNFTTTHKSLEAGVEFEIPFYVNTKEALSGFQFTLDFDPLAMDLLNIELASDQLKVEEVFGTRFVSDGLLTVSWFSSSAQDFSQDTPVFFLKFRTKQAFELKDKLSFNSRLLRTEAYTDKQETFNLGLIFEKNVTPAVSGFRLLGNRPNPFTSITQVAFQLPETDEVYWRVMDTAGRVLLQGRQFMEAGYQELLFREEQLDASGLLFYRISTRNYSGTGKMVLLKR